MPPARVAWLRTFAAAAAVALLWSPFWSRSWFHRSGRLALIAAYAYLAVLIGLLSFENRLLYRPEPANSWLPPPAGIPVEDVNLAAADGTRIHAWWGAPDGWVPAKGAVLFCHGNGGNVSWWGQEIPIWQAYLGAGVLVFDYPGYGKSGGFPSEAGCYAAADAAYDWLTREKKILPEHVLLVGRSLGCAVATDVASRRPCRALILCSAFTSFPDMAQEKYPIFPGRWLVHNRFDNIGKITSCRCPVFIAHGTGDRLVPFSQSERLFAAAHEPKRFHAMQGLDHNDEPDDGFYKEVQGFLKETAPLP